MNDTVIRAEHLGKSYVIGHRQHTGYHTLGDTIMRYTSQLGRSLRSALRGEANVQGDVVEEFWALKDLNFDIRRGDVIGIVGKNGAGKSTLLKILSRITEPSEGRVTIKGRVASLLEVGTGFHPELTGRENIFLNGSILGMSRAEVARKLDAIVDFSGVERFIDTPVKRYSSGMYVRLAFSVAAHLEPEILIIDEVLAVGDEEFQRKCIGKMQSVSTDGRTIVFVSHNLAPVRRLCTKAMLLTGGRVELIDDVEPVIDRYYSAFETATSPVWVSDGSFDNDIFVPAEMALRDRRTLEISGTLMQVRPNLTLALRVFDNERQTIFVSTSRDARASDPLRRAGPVRYRIDLPLGILRAGTYSIELIVYLHNERYVIGPEGGPAISFDVPHNVEAHSIFDEGHEGAVQPLLTWMDASVGTVTGA